MLVREAVNALPILALVRLDLEAQFLANGARQEAADRGALPAGGLRQLLQRGAARPFQEVQNLFGLAPLVRSARLVRGLGALRAFSALLRRCWLLPRLGLRGRNVGATWRNPGFLWRIWLLSRGRGRFLVFGIGPRH